LEDRSSLSAMPRVVLAFYEGGVVLQKRTPDGAVTAYPVDPAQVQEVFAQAPVRSPILPAEAVCWGRVRGADVFAWWRPPGRETLLVEVDEQVHGWTVPLPGLVVVSTENSLALAALKGKERPLAGTPVYNAPLPNTDSVSRGRFGASGKVCLGSARLPEAPGPQGFAEVWQTYVRSTFNAHLSENKSASFPEDVRGLLLCLHQQEAEEFPEDELLSPDPVTLEEFLDPWMRP